MKKIDIHKYITDYLSKNPYYINDALGKKYTIDSYEKYITFFQLIRTTYNDNIKEFAEEATKYLDYMNSYIEKVLQEANDDTIVQHITNNLRSTLHFNSYNPNLQAISIHPESYSIQLENSKEAFINIYEELGYDCLKTYIDLTKSPSLYSSYINDASRQIVAMKFMLFKTNHHSPRKLQRDLSAKTIYDMSKEHINETLDIISKTKDDYVSYMDEQKQEYKTWFDNTNSQTQEFINMHTNMLKNLEDTYEEKLKVSKPAEFMNEQANKYRLSFYLWCIGIFVITLCLLALLALILSPTIQYNDKLITINFFDNDAPFHNKVLLIAMVSINVYILRTFIKMAISSRHLMEEYKQKYSLTYFYLALVNDGKLKDPNTQNVILASLFNKADTGLIKNDNSSEPELSTLLSYMNRP